MNEPKEEATGYKVGDVLENKEGDKRKVLGVCGEVYFMSEYNEFDRCGGSYTLEQLNNLDFHLPRLFPQNGDKVFYITSIGKVETDIYCSSPYQLLREAFNNLFKTREEAEAKLEKIKSI